MKNLFLILGITFFVMFSSCSTTHKIKTESHKTVDSVVNTTKDSSSISKEINKTDNFSAKGVDITLNYDNQTDTSLSNTDTVKWTPFYYKPNKQGTSNSGFSNLINQAVSSNGLSGHIPTSIHIHIDSLGNSTVENTKTDSSIKKETIQAKVKSISDDKSKDVKRTGLGFGSYVIIGIVVLVVLVFVAFKFKLL